VNAGRDLIAGLTPRAKVEPTLGGRSGASAPASTHPSASTWDRIETIVARFEAACWRGERPEIDAYLPREDGDRALLLLELIHADLELRIKAGQPMSVGEYLARYPELADDPTALASLKAAEVELMRGKLGVGGGCGAIPAASSGPRRIGRFVLEEEAGRGGFGVVYRAFDPELGRVVAVKVAREGHRATPEEAARLMREARSAARLKHPGIVTVFEAGRVDDQFYLVSEFISGSTLTRRIAEDPPRSRAQRRQAAATIAEVALALDFAHRQGIIHRDIKPSNILLEDR
jgi:serine/threonine-protein kinase